MSHMIDEEKISFNGLDKTPTLKEMEASRARSRKGSFIRKNTIGVESQV